MSAELAYLDTVAVPTHRPTDPLSFRRQAPAPEAPTAPTAPEPLDDEAEAPDRTRLTPEAALGAATAAARTIARALAEVLQGTRPVHQLSPWLDQDMFDKVCRRVGWERQAMLARGEDPERAAARVLGCHVQCVLGGCECTATLVLNGHGRALCFRIETHRARWRAVALELG